MAILTIHRGSQTVQVEFTAPQSLAHVLAMSDMPLAHPCGGRGSCGKCAVALFGEVSPFNASEQRFGTHLACQALLLGDAEVSLPALVPMEHIESGHEMSLHPAAPMSGTFGAAVDIGTTTVALMLYNLTTGHCVGASSMMNPQTSVSADVIGRIDASLHGQSDRLQGQVVSALMTLLTSACAQAGINAELVASLVITGNTTMLYLLTGRDPSSLSHAPFHADHFFGIESSLLNRCIYLPSCLHAFVGADTACALLSSGIMQRTETALLCDVGTNGELALWHRGKLYIASTAAGPAFEGAGISCGCTSIPGAIDRVELVNGRLYAHTISEAPAVGICGSGLIDAVAASLDLGLIDETGLIEDDCIDLGSGIHLTQSDIRSVQLAKAAIHAGIQSVLEAAACSPDDVSALYLAGGFGKHMNIRSAVRIGLIPSALAAKVRVIGNAALDGAAMLLMDTGLRSIICGFAEKCHHVRLDANPVFTDHFINAMLFEGE